MCSPQRTTTHNTHHHRINPFATAPAMALHTVKHVSKPVPAGRHLRTPGGDLPEVLRPTERPGQQRSLLADRRVATRKVTGDLAARRGAGDPVRWRLMGVDVFLCRAPRCRGHQSSRKVTLAAWHTRTTRLLPLLEISS